MTKNKSGFRLQFTSLLRPAIYMILFSCVYSLGYMWITRAQLNTVLSLVLEAAWLVLYGLGLYFVCTLVWGKKHGVLNGQNVIKVLLWNLCTAILIDVISMTFSYAALHQLNLMIVLAIQLLAGLIIIFLIPASILFYKGLYEQEESLSVLFRSIWTSLKAHPAAILNAWLILFLLMAAWDTLFSGPLSIYYGFNASVLLVNLVYIGNPMFYWIMMLMISKASGAFLYMILLYLLYGLIMVWLELNLIGWIGLKWQKSQEA